MRKFDYITSMLNYNRLGYNVNNYYKFRSYFKLKILFSFIRSMQESYSIYLFFLRRPSFQSVCFFAVILLSGFQLAPPTYSYEKLFIGFLITTYLSNISLKVYSRLWRCCTASGSSTVFSRFCPPKVEARKSCSPRAGVGECD